MDDVDIQMESTDLGLSNEEAVSLFSSSLNKALEKQNSVIVNSITTLTEKLASSAKSASHVPDAPFEFKHEGHKIQFGFNQHRLSKLTELEQCLQEGELSKAR